MSYMRTITISIEENHPLFQYADRMTRLANNLSNAARFRQRQVLTAVSKQEADWTENERTVMEEIRRTIPQMKNAVEMPSGKKHFLGYRLLDAIMKYTGNPDYYAEGLPRQTAQNVLKQAVKDMKGFYASCREYHKNPDSFTGKPVLPGYRKKGGHTTALVSNQDCKLKCLNGKWYAAFPFVKDTPVCIGSPIPNARLKQVCITPENGRYRLSFQIEVGAELSKTSFIPERICAIDFGLDNLMAVTNNCNLPFLIYKGGVAKAANQKYNKTIAAIVSEQTLRTGKKFVPDAAYYAATNRRNDQINDFMHKCAKHLITWCVENRIDTIVMGVNPLWKQKICLGHKNNQEFVQIPIDTLRSMIHYLSEWNGIRCVKQEESYTSKASFPDLDPIPVYGEETEQEFAFSGKRKPTQYAGMKKSDGFRGLYVTKSGLIINSDLNGSANILRKAYPQAFDGSALPEFKNVIVIRHPYIENRKENRNQQLSVVKSMSHAKRKRQERKARSFFCAAV